MKILDLPLKKKWYEMIESGGKREEYREYKDYWYKRLIDQDTLRLKPYTHVRFRYGYTKRTMLFKIDSITVDVGNPDWGAPEYPVFIIKFHKENYMKKYTDLGQSRTLAKILSHDTADQTWERVAIAGANLDVPDEIQYRHNGDMPFQIYSGIGIPCWSLGALLDVIPYCSLRRFVDGNWIVAAEFSFKGYRESLPNKSAVDACVELITTLHEQKLI